MVDKKIKHLILDEEFEEDVTLIALYSSVEIFRVVYQLNKILELRLKRTDEDIDFKNLDSVSYYPLYHYRDKKNHLRYYMVANIAKTEPRSESEQTSLFKGVSRYNTYLIPERKKVDYFLKIEGLIDGEEFIDKLKKIKQISAVHTEHIDRLKSYTNLIFD